MCGASKGEKESNAMIMSTAKDLHADFGEVFGQNENILNSIMGVINPIMEAGASQNGMSPAEEAAQRTEAMETTAAAGRQVAQAVEDAQAAKGGGNMYLPKGADEAINEDIAERTASQNAAEQLGITQRGYDIGRENFWNATKVAQTAPGELESPALGYGNLALKSAKDSLQSNELLTSQSRAWEAPVGGLIGNLAGSALGPVGSAIGNKLGSAIGS